MRRPHGARGGFLFREQVVLDVIAVVGPGRIGRHAGQAFELQLADVTPAPLGKREAERLWQQRGERRQVFVDQLLLQRDGGGGDHHAGIARQGERDGGGAVSQRFADAGAGLDHGDGAHRLVVALDVMAVVMPVAGVGASNVRLLRLVQIPGLFRLPERGGAERVRHLFGHAPLALAATKPLARLNDPIERLQGGRGPFQR